MSLSPESVGTVGALADIAARNVVKRFQLARWADARELSGALQELGDDLLTMRGFPSAGCAASCAPLVWCACLELIEAWTAAGEAARSGALLTAAMGAADLLQAHLDGTAEKPVGRAVRSAAG